MSQKKTTAQNIHDITTCDDLMVEKVLYMNHTDDLLSKMNDNVLLDAEICESYSKSDSIIDEFKPQMVFEHTKQNVSEILSTPIHNKGSLKQRQEYIQDFDNELLLKELTYIKERSRSIEWIFTKRDKEIEDIFNTVYFSWWVFDAAGANKSSTVLTTKNFFNIYVSPTIGILSPVIYFIIPYLVIRFKLKINLNFTVYLKTLYQVSSDSLFNLKGNTLLKSLSLVSYISSLFFYFHGIFQSIDTAKYTHQICSVINTNMNNLLEIYNKYQSIFNYLEKDPFYKVRLPVKIEYLDDKFTTHLPFSDFGNKLTFFKNIPKEKIVLMMNHIYILDALCAIKTTIQLKNLNPSSFDFNHVTPYISLSGLWHLNLNQHTAVKNDFSNKCIKKNTMITGPNAGGKSTFIKSILVNIVLSQTITFSATDSTIMTPFEYVGSQIHIPDCKGKESLFEAEMHRCKQNIDHIKNNTLDKSIVFMDEIFNSTNSIEGISGAYSILKNIAQYQNSMVIMTTHFPYLAKLNKYSNYSLYKFDCNQTNQEISYAYKITKGLSKQYIALDILKANNFDDEIIVEANLIKNKILCS
jgi:hypothetical protein